VGSGRNVEVGAHGLPHIDHGYAVTSHSSQEQTAERVLIHADTERGAKDLLNHRMAYVSVSRGQWDAQIFTNDRHKLVEALNHDVSHKSALQPEQAISGMPQKIGAASEHVVGRSMGYGLGL
jgi:ATP-dependent exoDNAse (exonuclease V) alpha subunit